MPRPFEFLFSVKELGEIDCRLWILKELWRGRSERVGAGECRWDAGGGVGADRSRKRSGALRFDLERDWWVRPSRHAGCAHMPQCPTPEKLS
jgi:hypothetical protein